MDYQKQITDSLFGLKDPNTMKDISCNLKAIEISDDNAVTVVLGGCCPDKDYKSLEHEIAQRVLSFEGVTQVQVQFQ
ncbi:hypothetical protein V6C27_04850 [Peptococcaceae bacterium 1198_IL3148]